MPNIKEPESKPKKSRKNKPGAGRIAVVTEEKIRELMPDSKGNASNIAKQLGVTPSALYRFLANKPDLKYEIRAYKEEFHDEVEEIMEELIRERNVPMIIFYARTQMRNRGYNERVEITDANGDPLKQPITINYILPPSLKNKENLDPLKEIMPKQQHYKNIIENHRAKNGTKTKD